MVGGEDERPREAMVEKRRHVRVEAELKATFAVVGERDRWHGRAVTRDISHGGACLAVFDCTEGLFGMLCGLPLLDVAIDIPRVSNLQGRVEWVRPPAQPGAPVLIGMEFRNLGAADETAIIDLIAHIRIGVRDPRPGDGARARAAGERTTFRG